jgi:hypothetical protein
MSAPGSRRRLVPSAAAKVVTMHLRANAAGEFSRTFAEDVLPLLRQQTGFEDEISFVSPERGAAIAISLWDGKESAEAYTRDVYPQVLKRLAGVIEGTPHVEAYELSNSTLHQIASDT